MGRDFRYNDSYRKVRSLMERMERPYGFFLTESFEDRRQVSRDEIFDVLNKQNDNPNTNHKWASVTYAKPGEVYKSGTRGRRYWRKDDVSQALDKNKDKSSEDWYQTLDAYNQTDLAEPNPIKAVIAVQRYNIHWKSPDKWKEDYGKQADELKDLRMSVGLAIDSDGMMGDNHNQRTTNDYGLQQNQTGNNSIDIDTKISKFTGKAYIVDDNGNIVNEIPYDVLKSMAAKSKTHSDRAAKPEKDAIEQLAPEILEVYTQKRREIMSQFSPKNLKFDQILCIAAWDGEQSYYYINDKLMTTTVKDGDVLVNQQAMVELAEKQLDEIFTGINDFSKENADRFKE